MASYEERTVAELREICRGKGIPGMSKARKDDIIEALRSRKGSSAPRGDKKEKIITELHSSIFRSDGRISKVETTVHVSAGAASFNQPLVGKNVGQAAEIYKHILNVDPLDINALVNGKAVESDYVLRSGDNLEFLKPASRKG
jgi:molybdopterin converting factor small subunit